ncbi:syntaxin 5 [Cystoisospora suis]|uniref:Syntaxin 5 n=1 Tax=Cystoisospora suis TaxID=483139 RepID=A0A2C6LB71_9APIC|nr:syntaxin 5 [Cystoisospora suis]
MPCDRTADFFAFAERTSPGTLAQSQQLRIRSVRQDSSFNAAAADIGAQLRRTSAKLQDLAKFARQRSIYNDRTAQTQDLTNEIKKSITELNGKIESLERIASDSSGGSSKQSLQHHTAMTDMLKARLLDVTKEFKDVLLLRTENMKRQDERRSKYSFTGALDSSSSAYGRKSSMDFDLEG